MAAWQLKAQWWSGIHLNICSTPVLNKKYWERLQIPQMPTILSGAQTVHYLTASLQINNLLFFRTQVMKNEQWTRIYITYCSKMTVFRHLSVWNTQPSSNSEKLCTPLLNTGLRVNLPQKIPVRLKGSGFCVKHVSNMKCSLSDKLQQGAIATCQS